VAQNFKENVLSKGETERPMILHKRFRGQESKPDALLMRAGLVQLYILLDFIAI
jgi:Zn-dependent oligopeptidase